MSKVFLVNKHYDNHEPYEDGFWYDETLIAFDTKKKAENFIKGWLPKHVFSTREEAKEALLKEWETLSEKDKEEGFDNSFDDFFDSEACFVEDVSFDVEDTNYVIGVGFTKVNIVKRIAWSDQHRWEHPSVELTIKEMEVY